MRRVLLARSKGLAGPLLALALLATGGLQAAKADQMNDHRVGLGGYCPVCILDANKWAKGSPEHQATYDGVTYYFPEEAIKEKFLANPAKYVPASAATASSATPSSGTRPRQYQSLRAL